jgi:hypothetical protein
MPTQKFLSIDANGNDVLVAPASAGGSGQANKIPALDDTGRLPDTMMPAGFGTSAVERKVASGVTLLPNDLVNIYFDQSLVVAEGDPEDLDDGWRVRKASAGVADRHAVGYVKGEYAAGENAVIWLEGKFALASALAEVYLSATTAGSAGAYDAAGAIRQLVGRQVDPGLFEFIQGEVTILGNA